MFIPSLEHWVRGMRVHAHLQAIKPGISASASSISKRPKSAWVISLTLYCTNATIKVRHAFRLVARFYSGKREFSESSQDAVDPALIG